MKIKTRWFMIEIKRYPICNFKFGDGTKCTVYKTTFSKKCPSHGEWKK